MSGGSKKPCPGCGEVKDWRKASEVCGDCKLLLERAQWLEEQVNRLADDEVIVSCGKYSYCNEYLRSEGGWSDRLMAIFHRIAEAGSRPAAELVSEFNLLGKIDYGQGISYAVMSRPLAEAVRDLREAVATALADEYEAGRADGHKLLMRLASGDLAMNEFDVKTREK